jgi:hypothetical protein
MVEAFDTHVASLTMKHLLWLKDFARLTVFYFWIVVFIGIIDSRVSQGSHEKTDGRQANKEDVDGSAQRPLVEHGLEVIEGVCDDCQEDQSEDGEAICMNG